MSIASTYSPKAYEYVSLISDELEEVVPATIDAQLEQFESGSSSRFTIFNGRYLGVSRKGVCDEPGGYWINLAFLDPKSARRADRFWSTLAGILALLAAGAMTLSTWDPAIAIDPVPELVISALAAATLVSIAIAIRRYFSRIVFLTRHGRIPVLWLSVTSPDRKRVREFIRCIHAAIDRGTASFADAPRGHYLRDEMKEHRRLHNGGVLNDHQFHIARRLILEAHD